MTVAFFKSFVVPGVPLPQPRPRAMGFRRGNKVTARVYDPGTTDAWKKMIWVYCQNNRPDGPLDAPRGFGVKLIFHMPRPKYHLRSNGDLKHDAPSFHLTKPDLDNLAKSAIDAITDSGVFWKDDGAVADLHLMKVYSLCPAMLVQITVL